MTNRISKYDDDDNTPDGYDEENHLYDLCGDAPEEIADKPDEVKAVMKFIMNQQKGLLAEICRARFDVFAFRMLVAPNGVHRLWKLQSAGSDSWEHVGDAIPPKDVSEECVDFFSGCGIGGVALTCMTSCAEVLGCEPSEVTEDGLREHFDAAGLEPEHDEAKWPAMPGGGTRAVAGTAHGPGELLKTAIDDANPGNCN